MLVIFELVVCFCRIEGYFFRKRGFCVGLVCAGILLHSLLVLRFVGTNFFAALSFAFARLSAPLWSNSILFFIFSNFNLKVTI